MYKQGEILLIPIPFSDLTSSKKRPVLVISNDLYNEITEDVVVVAITSNIRGNENEVIFDNENMEEGSLPKESCVRADKIYTLSKSIIVKKYGKIAEDKIDDVKLKLLIFLMINPKGFFLLENKYI